MFINCHSINMNAAQYKFSNFFVDQRIKILESEYGGRCKSQNAAKTIQSTFRKYMLRKKFVKLCEMNKRKKKYVANLPKTNISSFDPYQNQDHLDTLDICMPDTPDNNDHILSSIIMEFNHTVGNNLISNENKVSSVEVENMENMVEHFYDAALSYRNTQIKSNVESSLSNEISYSVDETLQAEDDVIKPTLVEPLQKKRTSPIFFLNSVIEEPSIKSRKLLYKIGLNLFNKNPESGIRYLIANGFITQRPYAIAKFFQTRSGISKQMIGEYLGDINKHFNSQVLMYFTNRIDISSMDIDVALRKFQSFFRMPGEAQKIEKLMEVFSTHYCKSNINVVSQFRNADTVFLLAFAIIMLNTDLHNPNIKPKKKMKIEEFIKNLEGLDCGDNIETDLLVQIYENISNEQLKPAVDHTSLVMKIEKLIIDKKPRLVLPFRRLVCYCRLFEIKDLNKREKLGAHQREIFLFNDSLLILKLHSRKKSLAYKFKQLVLVAGLQILIFNNNYYKYGVMLKPNICDTPLVVFNARNNSDQMNLIEDLREVIAESNEMESLRIQEELEKQHCKRLNMTSVHAEHHTSLEGEQSRHLTIPKFFRLSDIENHKIQKCASHSLGDIHKASTE